MTDRAGLRSAKINPAPYLRHRNLIQICLMGEFTTSALDRAALILAGEVRGARAA
jgi:hypothetical protein